MAAIDFDAHMKRICSQLDDLHSRMPVGLFKSKWRDAILTHMGDTVGLMIAETIIASASRSERDDSNSPLLPRMPRQPHTKRMF